LHPPASFKTHNLPSPIALATFSSAGLKVGVWDTVDGSLLWAEKLLPVKRSTAHSELAVLRDTTSETVDVAVLHDDTVELRQGGTGRMKWTWRGDSGVQLLRLATDPADAGRLFVVSSASGSVVVHTLDTKTGEKLSSSTEVASAAPKPEAVMVSGLMVVWVDNSSCKLIAHNAVSQKSASLSVKKVTGLACGSVVTSAQLDGALVVKSPDGQTALVNVDASLGMTVQHTYAAGAIIAGARDRDGSNLVMSLLVAEAEASISLVTVGEKSPADLPPSADISLKANGAAVAMFLSAYARKDGGVGTRALVVCQDHSLALVKDGVVVWRREEALASISQVEFVDLPSTATSSGSGESVDLVQQFTSLLMPKRAGHASEGYVDDYTVVKSRQGGLYTDKFGVRKLAIVMTGANKIIALNTETSQIVWMRFFFNESQEDGALKKLFVTRRGSNPECTVLAADTSSPDKLSTSLCSFNGLTGEEISTQALPFTSRHAFLLPDTDSEHRRTLLILDSSRLPHVFPDTPETNAFLAARASTLHWFEVVRSTNALEGFRVIKTGDGYTSEGTWRMVLPESERIDEVKVRSTEDSVFSPIHVTGTHDMLIKYLNPNLVAVSTVSSAAPFFKNSARTVTGGKESSVHLYCIDTVTGRVVYHVAHPHSAGPTNVALSENWLVHTYWSVKELRTELSVLELWEDTEQQDSVTDLMKVQLGLSTAKNINPHVKRKHFRSGKESGGKYFSSYEKHKDIMKEEQSFVFPSEVKALGVTSSEMGITSKNLIVATAKDEVVFVPRNFFNARRPMKAPSQEEMEEGLMQYSPMIPDVPTNYLSYNKTIAGLRAIKAVPAGGLESTSLVMVYGIDLFFALNAPSKTFDVLSEDFDKGLLFMTIAGLSVATFLASYASKRKDLEFMWR
jgi:hypothetical protein